MLRLAVASGLIFSLGSSLAQAMPSGGEVLQGLQQQAAAAGAGVALHVDRGNPAQRLYERCGFASVAAAVDNLLRKNSFLLRRPE